MIKDTLMDDKSLSLKDGKGIANYILKIILDQQILNGYGYEMLKREADNEEK